MGLVVGPGLPGRRILRERVEQVVQPLSGPLMPAVRRRRRNRRAGAPGRRRGPGWPDEAVAADRQHGAVGRLEGELGEPGRGEIGPDGGRGVGRPAVPGPDDLRPRRGRSRAAPRWWPRCRSGLMFPKTPHTSTRSAGTWSRTIGRGTRRPRRPGPVRDARRRGTVTGEGDEGGVELDEERGDVATARMGRDDVDHVAALAGAHAHDPDGPSAGAGHRVEDVAHHGLDEPESTRQGRRRVLVRRRASASSASPRRRERPSR